MFEILYVISLLLFLITIFYKYILYLIDNDHPHGRSPTEKLKENFDVVMLELLLSFLIPVLDFIERKRKC